MLRSISKCPVKTISRQICLTQHLHPSLPCRLPHQCRLLQQCRLYRTEVNKPQGAVFRELDAHAVVDRDSSLPDLNIDVGVSVFKRMKLTEMARALFVFKLCSYEIFVNNSLKLMSVGSAFLGRRLYRALMRSTVYGQFVGGETREELLQTVERLQGRRMGPMLCVPNEEDVGETGYCNEKYTRNLNTILDCISLSAEVDRKYPMAQVKLTALVPGQLVGEVSGIIPDPLADPRHLDAVVAAFEGHKVNFDGLDSLQNDALLRSIDRMRKMCERASSLGCRLLVDAEYTYLNPALRLLSLGMMLKYNTKLPIVSYTYQNYLKATYQTLVQDVEMIRGKGVCFGVKLVRGAYMDSERKLAAKHGLPDPVHACFDDTSAMYNQSMVYLLDKIQENPKSFFVIIASHNEDTVKYCTRLMHQRNITNDNGSLFFGQLYGMSNHISYALGDSLYSIYKSIPYGSIEDVLPYLSRRATENSAMMKSTKKEQKMLARAIINRVTLGLLCGKG